MLLMLWTLDFLFVVVDYFIYLLEPIFVRLSSSLSFCQLQAKYTQKWPWLLEGSKHMDMSLKGLSLEMEQFYAMRMRHQRKISLTRSSLAQTASESLRNQWPWLRFHHACKEPSERQLDWFGHDLGLVADWDCCRLSIALHQLQSSRDETPELELVARSARGVKLLVRIGSEPSHVLTWQLISLRNRKRDELRAALAFYCAQLHPELPRLHNILTYLLDDLVEPTSSQLAKKALLHAGKSDISQPLYLSRYALLLMIVAHLRSKKDSKAILAEHLVDFLLSYSHLSSTKHRIVPKPIKLKHRLGLELVEEKVQESTDEQRLEVLDPVELAMVHSGKKPDNLADLIAQLHSSSLDSSSVEEANITRDFCHEKELAERCRKLSKMLETELAMGKCNDDGETILSSLLISSGAAFGDYARPCFNKLLDQKAPLPNPKKAVNSLQRWLWRRKVSDEHGHHHQVRRRAKGRQMNFPWRKVLINLLYLFIFLLIRDELLRQVLRWRTLLNEQAREDWIQLKHQLFPHGYNSDEFDLSDFFNTDRHPMGGVDAFDLLNDTVDVNPEEKLPAKDSGESIEKQLDEIWATIATNATLEVGNATANNSAPGADNGHMDGKKLLAELMRAMMSEALADGDLELSSLFNEIGLNVSDLRDVESDANLIRLDDDYVDNNSDEIYPGDDKGEKVLGDKWTEKRAKLDLFGLASQVRNLADKLKMGKVPKPRMEETIAEIGFTPTTATTTGTDGSTPHNPREAALEADSKDEL